MTTRRCVGYGLWKTFQLFLSLPERDRRAVVRLIHSLVKTKRSIAA
jgi:hypothetical protein